MKKVNLSFMAVMIISLVVILIMNTMAIFAYRDEVVTTEGRKDNMLSLNIKYTCLMNNLNAHAKQYFFTNDEMYKTEFFNLLNNYLENDFIALDYRVMTEKQTDKSLKRILADRDFSISSQAEYIQFNSEEYEVYKSFLNNLKIHIDILSEAVNERNQAILMSPSFDAAYVSHLELLQGLTRDYIDRLNRMEDDSLVRQNALEYSLVFVSLVLLGFATVTFYVILRENAYNSYFSKLYNTVVENIDGGIAILDKDYRFDYMNTKYREILGITMENPRGKTLHDTFEMKLADTLENINGEGKLDLIICNRRKNIMYSYLTIEDDRGNNKYVHLIRDATKTEELQTQLRKQLKEINYYSQAKDSFIANISHEIKTPINAILGMLHFLKSTRLSENQKDLVRKIETSSEILLTIISDVLDLSKIKNNSLSLYPTDFSLKTVINNVEDMFSNQLTFKGVRWETYFDFRSDLCLHLDKTRFVQVLVNLINNAYKFTESGYVRLSVETLSENEDMVLLQFCVEDSGIGIAEKDIFKLFREFEQLENHLTKQHQGTGLGLFICKNIIESMNGRIWVKSTKGKGSKFYFSLPAKKALVHKQCAAAKTILPLEGGGGKVLVVEDTEINAEVVVKLLNDVSIVCDTAADGAEAIEMFRNRPADYYDLILMDIHMPKMDGYTAAGILKKEIGVTSPIVALTASDINDQVRAEHADTIEAFILKPFKAAAFYNAISPYFHNQNKSLPQSNGERQSSRENTSKSRDPFAGREEAIKNLGGLESIYFKHVEKFKANYANTAGYITELLAENNRDEARRLAHSVKGLSGTLGMPDMMEASAELEKAILKGEGYDLSIELENFDAELKAVIRAI